LGTPKIDLGIDDFMATPALTFDLIFEKLHPPPAFWALGIKDIPWSPKPHILPRAFHMLSPLTIM
jgi:hypothetical protein